MDETEDYGQIRAARINFADFFVAGFTLLKGVGQAFVDAYETLQVAYMAHSKHIMDQQEFQRDAGREIESITREGNGG